jgi:hypothetical protein
VQSLAKLAGIVSLCVLLGCSTLVRFALGLAPNDVAIEDSWGERPRVAQIEAGLREVLQVSARRAVAQASRRDGFWLDPSIRIGVPTTDGEGLRCPPERLELDLNRAAERASASALGILGTEIRALRVADPQAVLNGGPTAATDQLRAAASSRLGEALAPVVLEQMRDLDDRDCGDLVRHVADGTVAGLLVLLGREEQRLRDDPTARSTPMLRKVFAAR